MILSDGSTTITINTADGNGDSELIRDVKITAGGDTRTRIAGERFVVNERFETTGTQLRNILNLIKNNASSYTYTPTTTPPEWESSDFPMIVDIEYIGKTTRVYDGEIKYFVSLRIQSAEVY